MKKRLFVIIWVGLVASLGYDQLAAVAEESAATITVLQCDPYSVPSIILEFEATAIVENARYDLEDSRADNLRELKKRAIVRYREGDFLESLGKIEEYLAALSKSSSNSEVENETRCAIIFKGQVEVILGRYEAALIDLEKSPEVLSSLPAKQAVISTCLRGEALSQLGKRRDGFLEMDKARSLLVENVDSVEMALVYDMSSQMALSAALYGNVKYAHRCWGLLSRAAEPGTAEEHPVVFRTEEQSLISQCRLNRIRGSIQQLTYQYDEACYSFARAIAAREKLRLRNDRVLVQLHIQVAIAQMHTSKEAAYVEAELLLGRASELLNAFDLDCELEAASILAIRGEIALRRKDYGTARLLLTRSTAKRKATYEDHPDIAVNNINLLTIPSEERREDKALSMAIETARLSDDSIVTAAHYSLECARTYNSSQRNKAAEEMYRYTVRLLAPQCGPSHCGVLAATDELAKLYERTGKVEQAASLLDTYLESLNNETECVEGPKQLQEIIHYVRLCRDRINKIRQARAPLIAK